MALINCPECGKEISDKAMSCPYCGYPIIYSKNNYCDDEVYEHEDTREMTAKQTNQKHQIIIGTIIIFLFLFTIVWKLRDISDKGEIASGMVETVSVESNSIDSISSNETANVEDPITSESTATTTNIDTKEEFIASCQKIPYKTLARTPDEYIGQRIVLTVKINQVMQGGWFDDNEYYRVYTNDEYDMWFGDEYFMYDSRIDDTTKILSDDVWKVYAEFIGTETVTRALTGTKEDVPAIKVYYADLVSE